MKSKRRFHIFSVIALTSTFLLALTLSLSKSNERIFTRGKTSDYSFTVTNSNAPSSLPLGSYAREGEEVAYSKGDYSLNLKYRLAQRESNQFVKLAPHGFIYNEVNSSTHSNKITGLVSIQATYSSSSNLTIRTSIRNDGKEFGSPQTLTSGSAVTFDDEPYYFIIEAGDSEASISSITFNYSCSDNSLHLSSLKGSYTGTGNDGYIYKLTLNGSNAQIESLNKPTNSTISGAAEIINGNQIKCTFSINDTTGHYISTVSEDHRVFTYSSKDGSGSALPQIDFYKVYKVEDFESYSATGDGFGGSGRSENSLFTTSGLRSQWHSDWNTSSTSYAVSYFGNSDWRLMGSTDFLTFTSNKGRNSSKAAAFKGNSNGLRYTQMKAPLGIPSIIGQGNYLSFWAKVYTNSSLTTVKTTDTSIKVNAFYNNPVTGSNYGTKTAVDVNIPGNSDWTRYTIPLDNSKNYYAFGLYDNKTSSTIYTVIDDVEIYTVNPYAQYIPPYPTGTYNGTASVKILSVSNFAISIAFGTRQNGLISVMLANTDAVCTGVTFNDSTLSFSISTTGSYSGYTFGNITGNYDPTNDRLTNISCDGGVSSRVTNNGSITATRLTNYWNCDGETSSLQSTFKRRYNSGSGWTVDTGNTDRITSNKSQFVSGLGSLKLRPYSGGPVALNFNNDFSTTLSVENVQYWVYNPSQNNLEIRMWYYTSTNFGGNAEIGSVTAVAGKWTYVAMGFGSVKKIYNFQIADFNNSGVQLSFDNIALF